LAVHYRLLFNLYRDLVPFFVIARWGSKKLVWTFQLHVPRGVCSTHQIRLTWLGATLAFLYRKSADQIHRFHISLLRIPMYRRAL